MQKTNTFTDKGKKKTRQNSMSMKKKQKHTAVDMVVITVMDHKSDKVEIIWEHKALLELIYGNVVEAYLADNGYYYDDNISVMMSRADNFQLIQTNNL